MGTSCRKPKYRAPGAGGGEARDMGSKHRFMTRLLQETCCRDALDDMTKPNRSL